MNIHIKMLGDLRQFLPPDSQLDQCDLDFPPSATLLNMLQKLQLPDDQAFIVLRNESIIQENHYANTQLETDDKIVIFMPIKGG